MGYGTAYTNGVIAVKEKQLLGEKLLRFPGMTAEEVFRALAESGFGAGGDDPVAAEEASLDGFIREYAPDHAHAAYFLLPRDFHNMKALVKAKLLSADPSPMLAPVGFQTVEELREQIEKDPPVPWEQLEQATGAEIGAAFDAAMYARLFRVCRRANLRTLLKVRVDLTNILTACRASDAEEAEKFFLAGGTLARERLFAGIFPEEEKREAFNDALCEEFRKACLSAGKTPYTGAERILESFEEKFFFARRFGLEGRELFLYYVFRRRAEIRNVRMILVCLQAGVSAAEIEKRLVGGM